MSIPQALQVYTSPSSNQQQLKEAEVFLNNCESLDLVRYISELGSCLETNNNSSIVKLSLVLLGNAIKVDKLNNNNNFDFNALSNTCREIVQEKLLGNLVFGGSSSFLSNGIVSRSCARCLLLCDKSTIETTLRKVVENAQNSLICFFSSSFVSTLYEEIIATGFAALKYIDEQAQNNDSNNNNSFTAIASHFLNAVPTCLFFIREHLRNQVLPQLLEGFQKQPWNDDASDNQQEQFSAMISSIKTCFNILASIWSNAPSNDEDDIGGENNRSKSSASSSSTKREKYHALAQFAQQDISDFVLPFLNLLLDTKNEFRQKFSTGATTTASSSVVTAFAFHQLQNNILSTLHSAVDVFHPDLVLGTLLSRENSVSTVQSIFAESLVAQSLNELFLLTTNDDGSSESQNRNTTTSNSSSVLLLLQQEIILRSVTTTLRIIFTIMAQSGSGCQGNPQLIFNTNNSNNVSNLPCCLRHAFLTNQTLIRNCFCHLVTLRPFFENVLSSIDNNNSNNNNSIRKNSVEQEAKNICDDLDLTPSEVLSPIIDMIEFLANSESKRRNGFGSGDSRNYFNENNNNNKSRQNLGEEDVHKMIERRERETEEKQRHLQQHNNNNTNFSNDDDDDDIQRDEKILKNLHSLFSNSSNNQNAASNELQDKCLTSVRRDFLSLCVEAQKLASVFVSQTMKLEDKFCNNNNNTGSSSHPTAQNLQNWLKETFELTMSSSSSSSSPKSEITLLGVLFALPLCFSLNDEAMWISVVETVLLASSSSSKNISSPATTTSTMMMTQQSIVLASFISIYSPFSGSNTNKMIKKMISKSRNKNGKDVFTACMEKLCGENLLNLFGTSIWKGIDTLVEFSAKSSASASSPLTILNSFSIQMILSSLLAKAIDTFLLFTVKFSASSVGASASNQQQQKSENQFSLPPQIQQLLQQNSSTLVNFLFSSKNNNNNNSTPPFLVHLLQTFERNIPLSINPLHCWNSLTRSIAIATNLINNNNNNHTDDRSSSFSSSDLSLLPRIFETLQSSLFSCWKNELGRADVAELAEDMATKFLAWIPINDNNNIENNNNKNNFNNEDASSRSASETALFFNIYWLRDNILSELLSAKEHGRDNSAVACLTPFAIRIVSETVAVRGAAHPYASEAGRALYGHLCVACILSSAARETAVVQAAGSCLANLLEGVVMTSSSSLSLPLVSLPTFWIPAFENSFLAENSNNYGNDSMTMRIDQVTFCTIMAILRPEMLIHPASGNVFANAKFYELNLFKLTSLIVQYCNLVESSISSSSSIEENTTQQQQQQMIFRLFSTMTNICSKSIVTDLCFQPAALAWLRIFLVAPSQLFSASSPDQQQQCADILKRLSKLSLLGPDGIDTLVKITKSISIQDVFSIVTRIVQRIIGNNNQDQILFSGGFLNSTAFKVKSSSSGVSHSKKKNSKSAATFNNVTLIQALTAMSGAMFGALIDVCILKNKNSSSKEEENENYNDDNDDNYQDDDDDDEDDENNNQQENEEDDEDDDDEDEDSALSALDDSLLQILVTKNNSNNSILLNDTQLQQLHQLFQEWRTNVGSQQESINAMERLIPKKVMSIIRNAP